MYCLARDIDSRSGGDFADYFDPSDGDAAFELIERAIFDENNRQSKESQIEAAYTPPVWDATVDHVLAAFQALDRSVLQAHEGRK